MTRTRIRVTSSSETSGGATIGRGCLPKSIVTVIGITTVTCSAWWRTVSFGRSWRRGDLLRQARQEYRGRNGTARRCAGWIFRCCVIEHDPTAVLAGGHEARRLDERRRLLLHSTSWMGRFHRCSGATSGYGRLECVYTREPGWKDSMRENV